MTRATAAAVLLCLVARAWAGGEVTACGSDVQTRAGLNLRDAVAGGGAVTFACPAGTTLLVTMTHQLTSAVQIDGRGRITLKASPTVPMFRAGLSVPQVVFSNLAFGGAEAVPFGGVFEGVATALELRNVTVRGVGKSPGSVFGFVAGTVIRANRILADSSHFSDNQGAVLLAPRLTIRKSEFRSNRGQPFMPDFVEEGDRAVVESSFFSGNGVSVWRGDLMIRNCQFNANGLGSPAYGGALVVGKRAAIEKSEFANNRAPNGAAIWLADGDLSLRRVNFSSNLASGVGGALGVSSSTQPVDVTIRYSHFRDNQAATGGAIAFQQSSAVRALQGLAVNFARNTASNSGGAIDMRSGSVDLTRVQAVENKAGDTGGFIAAGLSQQGVRLSNALVVRNVARVGGAYAGPRLELVNATIADNQGAALALVGSHAASAKLTNSIILRNAGGGCSFPVAGRFADGGYNIQFPGNDCGGSIPVVDPGLDSMYVPVPDSPARFAGNISVCTAAPISGRDLLNEVRPKIPGRCAAGAIENTIENHALRALRRAEQPGRLAGLLGILNETRDGRGTGKRSDR